MGRARRDDRKMVEAGSWRLYAGWIVVAYVGSGNR